MSATRDDPTPRALDGENSRLAEALRESEERLRAILEAAEIGTWEWNIPADQVQWSPNIERIFGMAAGTFGGTYEAWLALVHPEDRVAVQNKVIESIRTLAPYHVEFRVLHPDGNVRWQSTRGYVIPDEHSAPRLLRGAVQDITTQVEARLHAEQLAHALQESEARYRGFVTQSTEGIWRIELERPVRCDAPLNEQIELFFRDSYLAECNDAMARMYGYQTAAELSGVRLGQLLMPEDPRNREYLAAFISGSYRLEDAASYEIDREGNRRVFKNSLVGAVENGYLLRAWGTQRDVTSEVAALEQAEAANRSKDDFLAMLGHELRNPLSPILTAVELMKLRDDTAFQKERNIIERQVKHVVRLVEDLLDVSRMTRGKVSLKRQRVDLADIIASAIELASPLLEQRTHRLSVQVPRGMIVDADPTRLAQVFGNLLTNAAKYTEDHGSVSIVAERVGAQARVCVSDSGIGIRPDILPRIFDLFVQEQQALDRSQGGLGLGLAIVSSLVRLHGGTIEAHSEGQGRGSTFSVHLPLQAGSNSTARSSEPAPRLRDGDHRVLVVDDNEDAAELLAEVLARWGNDVRIAHDGPAALKLMKDFTPDVALLDIGLPVMDGYELARRIRARPQTKKIKLLAVTGYGQPQDRNAAEQAGFSRHLVKPVDLRVLRQALSELLTPSALESE